MLEEVRAVGSMKTLTSLAGHMIADVVVLLKDIPSCERRGREGGEGRGGREGGERGEVGRVGGERRDGGR